MVNPVHNEDELALRRQRSKELWRSLWVLALVPAISAFALMIVYRTLYTSAAPGWSIDYVVYMLAYQLNDALVTVFALQILVWWQWKQHDHARWPIGLSLLSIESRGSLFALQFNDAFEASLSNFWTMTALSALMGWAIIAVNYLVLVGSGAFIQFGFHDSCGPSRVRPLARAPWSIRGMFLTTLVAALTLACLRWSRTVYAEAGEPAWYPTSDAGYAVWIMTSATGNVLCLLAAAIEHVSPSRWLSGLLVGLSVVCFTIGSQVWMFFVPHSDWELSADLINSAVNAVLMFLLHLYAFRRWSLGGYSLMRSDTPNT